MLNTGEIEFLGDDMVPRLRKLCVILEEADAHIAQIQTLELRLADTNSAVRERAGVQIEILKERLRRVYYFEDGSFLQKLQGIEQSLEEKRAKQT